MENERTVKRKNTSEKKKQTTDASVSVIQAQTVICAILLAIIFCLKLFGGTAFEKIKIQCRENTIGEFNFSEIVENTMAVFMSWCGADETTVPVIAQPEQSTQPQTVTSQSEEGEVKTDAPSEENSQPVADVAFEEGELDIPQTAFLSGDKQPGSLFLSIGENSEHILEEEPDLDEVITGASMSTYSVCGKGMLPTTGRISSKFGFRSDPFTGEKKFHGGLDIATPTGTPIAAAYGGRVIKAGCSETGYGNHIIIRHADGLITIYGHCSKLLVEQGTVVRAGEIIAEVGSTGNSTGPHLHFEARINGIKVSPAYLIDTSVLRQSKE